MAEDEDDDDDDSDDDWGEDDDDDWDDDSDVSDHHFFTFLTFFPSFCVFIRRYRTVSGWSNGPISYLKDEFWPVSS